MTEKRFSVKKSGSGLLYRDGDYEIDNTIQFVVETVEMKLNQLFEENEQLKLELGKLNILYKAKCKTEEQLLEMGKEVEKENEQLKTQLQNTSYQRDEFYRGVRENANRVGKLEKENEQLRKQLKHIQGTIAIMNGYLQDDGVLTFEKYREIEDYRYKQWSKGDVE